MAFLQHILGLPQGLPRVRGTQNKCTMGHYPVLQPPLVAHLDAENKRALIWTFCMGWVHHPISRPMWEIYVHSSFWPFHEGLNTANLITRLISHSFDFRVLPHPQTDFYSHSFKSQGGDIEGYLKIIWLAARDSFTWNITLPTCAGTVLDQFHGKK